MSSSDLWQQVLSAVGVLYNDNTPKALHRQTNDWLEEFQRLPQAWEIADKLLRDSSVGLQAHYIGAITLHTKIRRDLMDLPSDACIQLRDSLLQHMLRFKKGPNWVLSRICMSIASLASQISNLWPHPVNQLLQAFGSNAETVGVLVELLSAIPEEAARSRGHLQREISRSFDDMLIESCSGVLQFLNLCAHHTNSATTTTGSGTATPGQDTTASPVQISVGLKEIFQCYLNWLRFVKIPYDIINNFPMTWAAWDVIKDTTLFSSAVDLICEIVRLSGYLVPPSEMNPMRQKVFTLSAPLISMYLQAVQAQDPDLAHGLTRIFVEIGETYSNFIAQGSPEVLPIVGVLLECSANNDEDISGMTWQHWHLLSRAICSLRSKQAQTTPQQQQIFSGCFMKLIQLLMQHMMLPPNYETLASERQEEVKHYRRYELAHSARDAVTVITFDSTIESLSQALTVTLAHHQTSSDWRPTEAVLYMLRSVARNCDMNSSTGTTLCQLLLQLPTLPKKDFLLYTAIMCVGRYSDFIAKNPQLLSTLYSFVVNNFGNKELASACALSFRHLCESAPAVVYTSVTSILQLYDAHQQLPLSKTDMEEFFMGVGFVVSTAPPPDIDNILTRLYTPAVSNVHACVAACATASHTTAPTVTTVDSAQSIPTATSPDSILALCISLHKLGCLLRYVKPQPLEGHPLPGYLIFEKIWPLLDYLLAQFASYVQIIDNVCSCIRNAVHSCGTKTAPLVHQIVHSVCSSFTKSKNSAILFTLSFIISTFAKDSSVQSPPIADFIYSIGESSRIVLTSIRTPDDFANQPDVIREFCELITQFLYYYPGVLVPSDLLPPLFEWGLPGFTLFEQQAFQALKSMYENLFLACRPPRGSTTPSTLGTHLNTLLTNTQSQLGTRFVQAMLAGVAWLQPYARVCEVRDLILSARRYDYNLFAQMCASALTVGLPKPGSGASAEVVSVPSVITEAFVRSMKVSPVESASEDAEHVLIALEDFIHSCRTL
ncbi:armadillo-type protein [Pelomyxa schiedti]|nr:armadillo-type protein [Pelomyxa schiedti]